MEKKMTNNNSFENIKLRKDLFINDLLKKYSERKEFIKKLSTKKVEKINEIVLDGDGKKVDSYDIVKSFRLAINNSKEFFKTNGYDINDIKIDEENFAVQFVISKVLDDKYVTSSKQHPFLCCVIAAKGNWKPDNFIGYSFDEKGGEAGVYKTSFINNTAHNIKINDFHVIHKIFTNFKF